MNPFLPGLPSGRIAQRDLHREAAWMPSFQSTMNWTTALVGPALIFGNVFGALLLPLVFLCLVVLEAAVRALPLQRARWDAEGLRLEGPVQAEWRWEDIDELGFKKSDPHRIRFVANGQEHWLTGPADPKARDALLAHWKAYLTGEEQPLPARDPQWFDELDAKEARVRFLEGPAKRQPVPSGVRPALWLGMVLTTMAGLGFFFESTIGAGLGTTLMLLTLVATSLLVPFAAFLRAFFSSQRTGTVRVDQHGLALAPVGGTERRFSWDAVTALEHDELELRLTTEEGTHTYDFSQLRVERTRGMLNELEERWRARTAGEADEDGREAMRRLQQAAGQVG